MINYILLFITLFQLFSCKETVKENDLAFTEKQLEFVDPYKTNDTIVFISSTNAFSDTLIIRSVTKEQNLKDNPAYNRLNININPVPFRYGQVKETGPAPPTVRFVNLNKTSAGNKGTVSIYFKGFQCTFIPDTITSIKELTIGYKKYSCYVISHQFPEQIKENIYIQTIYWDKKEGLVSYQARGGGRWYKRAKT